MLQQPENWLSDKPQNAVVDGQLQAWGEGTQVFLDFRTGVEDRRHFAFATRCNADAWGSEADDVVALGVFTGLHTVVVVLARNPGRHEIVLQPGNPTTFDGFFDGRLVDVFHRHFFVGRIVSGHCRAEVSGGASGGSLRRVIAVVALELGVHVASPGFAALVVDQVTHINLVGRRIDATWFFQFLFFSRALGVQATFEAVALDVVNAGVAVGQIHHQGVLAVS